MVETALVALVVLFAGLTVRSVWREREQRWPLWALLASGTGMVTLVAAAVLNGAPRPEDSVSERPIVDPPEGYVTSNACQSCHPSQYATWHASYHRTMTQVASPETVLADFDDVDLSLGEWRFRLERVGDEYWVDMPEFDWSQAGPRGPRVRRKIALLTGSHHMQAYWYSAGNTRVLGLLPFVYNRELDRWLPRSASFLQAPVDGPASELGRWNKVCITCHTTLGRLLPVPPDGDDTRVAEFGISCEACHGPAEDHVAANGSVVRRYSAHLGDRRDASIVQPAHLDHRRSSEVCGQCHSTSVLTTQEAIDAWMKYGFPYRPGDRLEDTKPVVRGRLEDNTPEVRDFLVKYQPHLIEDSFWPDGMNRVSGREYNGLLETPCFERGEMSCLSCHRMHKAPEDPRPLDEWADDTLERDMRGNVACTQCHQDYAATERVTEHTHHAADSSGSVCYNCHMPHTTYGLLKAIRSHQLDSPSVEVSLKTGRPNACNQCHLDRTLDWAGQWMQQWYGIAPPELDDDEREVAASVLWLLRGDAGQRALSAWSMGWEDAQAASGNDWQALHLAVLFDDPYDAVRQIAQRSMQTLPGFERFSFDVMAPQAVRQRAGNEVLNRWAGAHAAGQRDQRTVLVDPSGSPRMERILELLRQRDDRPVFFAE